MADSLSPPSSQTTIKDDCLETAPLYEEENTGTKTLSLILSEFMRYMVLRSDKIDGNLAAIGKGVNTVKTNEISIKYKIEVIERAIDNVNASLVELQNQFRDLTSLLEPEQTGSSGQREKITTAPKSGHENNSRVKRQMVLKRKRCQI